MLSQVCPRHGADCVMGTIVVCAGDVEVRSARRFSLCVTGKKKSEMSGPSARLITMVEESVERVAELCHGGTCRISW